MTGDDSAGPCGESRQDSPQSSVDDFGSGERRSAGAHEGLSLPPRLDPAFAWLTAPQATVAWCAEMDELVLHDSAERADSVDALAEAIRGHYLRRRWDFSRADHAINMLAGYAQRQGVHPDAYWRVYLAFDKCEYPPANVRVLRAELARSGDRVTRDASRWQASEFDAWGRGVGVGLVVTPPVMLADLGKVDVQWPAGRCTEDVEGLRWL